MNKNRLLYIYTISLSLLFSCRQADSELLSATQQLGIPVSDKVQYIIYIPPYQCKTCLAMNLDSSYNAVRDRVHLVVNQDTSLFSNFQHAYFDRERLFFKIDAVKKNNKLILTENGKVIKIEPFTTLARIKELEEVSRQKPR